MSRAGESRPTLLRRSLRPLPFDSVLALDTLSDTLRCGRDRFPANEFHVELLTLNTARPFVNTTEHAGGELQNRDGVETPPMEAVPSESVKRKLRVGATEGLEHR
jgi:hypothetical protein